MPAEVRDEFGYGLYQAQRGEWPRTANRLHGGLRGVVELKSDLRGSTYRAVYTAKFAGAIYVLHVFQKKSTRGVATPRRELALIRQRLASAAAHSRSGQRSIEEET
jgi:phage-related protein